MTGMDQPRSSFSSASPSLVSFISLLSLSPLSHYSFSLSHPPHLLHRIMSGPNLDQDDPHTLSAAHVIIAPTFSPYPSSLSVSILPITSTLSTQQPIATTTSAAPTTTSPSCTPCEPRCATCPSGYTCSVGVINSFCECPPVHCVKINFDTGAIDEAQGSTTRKSVLAPVLGGVAGVLLVALIALCFILRRRRQRRMANGDILSDQERQAGGSADRAFGKEELIDNVSLFVCFHLSQHSHTL